MDYTLEPWTRAKPLLPELLPLGHFIIAPRREMKMNSNSILGRVKSYSNTPEEVTSLYGLSEWIRLVAGSYTMLGFIRKP